MSELSRVDKKSAKCRSRLTRLELNVAALPEIPQRKILVNEIERAKAALEVHDTAYSEALWSSVRFKICRIKCYYTVFPNRYDSKMVLWLRGLSLYAFIVLLVFGPCAVIVNVWKTGGESVPWIVAFVMHLGLEPLFRTVIDLGIEAKAYLWGLMGGAGAVVSMVKRFDSIASQKGEHWLIFAQGLFNPIVGSLSAIIVCRYAMKDVPQVPLLVLAFLAGFSERILAGIGAEVGGSKKAA